MADNLTKAARPLKFVDGTEYRMSPLSDKDIEELDSWVQSEFLATARKAAEGASEEEYERLMRVAMQEAMGLTWMSGPGAKRMATVYGMTRLCWQSVKRNHPDVTFDELRTKLFDPANIRRLREEFQRLNVPKKERPAQVRRDARSRRRAKSTGR